MRIRKDTYWKAYKATGSLAGYFGIIPVTQAVYKGHVYYKAAGFGNWAYSEKPAVRNLLRKEGFTDFGDNYPAPRF